MSGLNRAIIVNYNLLMAIYCAKLCNKILSTIKYSQIQNVYIVKNFLHSLF